MAKKPPLIGDLIVHEEPAFDRTTSGKVVLLLSAQFVYEDSEGRHRMCLYNEPWKKIQQQAE